MLHKENHLHKKILAMPYHEMLDIWRNTPINHCSPYFQGETGDLFKASMQEKRAALSPAKRAEISKQIGW